MRVQLVHDGVAPAARDHKSFTVGEIMAFTNNDYILVEDPKGQPAFELLADPKGRWLIPEPGPNVMWNTSYGMMRGMLPGYFTIDVVKNGSNVGMLSVNQTTGGAWYHSWHTTLQSRVGA